MARKRRTPTNGAKHPYNTRKGKVNSKSKANPREENIENSTNDPAWYAADPALMRDAASYPFSYATGSTEIHDMAVWNMYSNIDTKPYNNIAGIATFRIYPCVGTVLDATDPINVASQSVYSFVRHANSGHSNYDASDLMMYILAMANMYSFLVWCQRLYGYALTYDQRNRYIPRALIEDNYVDAVDLTNNLANFRFWINTLVSKMASFAVPATMSVFSRMTFLYSDYYIEGTVIKEQLYQYAPRGFYKFGLDANQKGELAWSALTPSPLMTVADIISYGNTLFNAIWGQEDFGIMSGDVLKAYGDNIIKLTSIPEFYTIVPKFDTMVLTQMKNADIVRVSPGRISQDASTGIILQTLVPIGYTTSDTTLSGTALSSAQATWCNNLMTANLKDYNVLTVDTDNPTPEVVMEATRLKVAYDGVKNWYNVGTELVMNVTIRYNTAAALPINAYSIVGTSEADLNALNQLESAARMFHYIPAVRIGLIGATKIHAHEWFDIDNFTILNFQDIKKLHEAAVINMLAVPALVKLCN